MRDYDDDESEKSLKDSLDTIEEHLSEIEYHLDNIEPNTENVRTAVYQCTNSIKESIEELKKSVDRPSNSGCATFFFMLITILIGASLYYQYQQYKILKDEHESILLIIRDKNSPQE